MSSVRIAIVDLCQLTRVGLARLLAADEAHPFLVVPTDSSPPPDAVLYGVDGPEAGYHDPKLHALLRGTTSTVLVTYWDDGEPGVESALACGAHAALSLRLPGAELSEQIQQTIAARDSGAEVFPPDGSCHPEIAKSGLTPRERDVLGLISQGLTNQEIADRLFITINSVKTYVRTAYRKIDVERRSQAIVWVERHGLTSAPPPLASVPEDIAAG